MNWHKITAEQANKIIASNRKKEDVGSLEEFEAQIQIEEEERPDFNNVVGQDSLTRFDKPRKQHKKQKSKRRRKPKGKSSKNG